MFVMMCVLDGRLAISRGDCVLDETVTFSEFWMERCFLSGAIARPRAWCGAAAGFRMRCFVVMAFASSVRQGVAWSTCPRVRLLLRLLQFDRDWNCAVSSTFLPLVPMQLRMLALWSMRLVVWVCCVHQVQRCVACVAWRILDVAPACSSTGRCWWLVGCFEPARLVCVWRITVRRACAVGASGRRVAYVPTDSLATAASAVRS